MGFQHHANIYKNLNDPIPGKRRDRQQNGQTLFHKTLLATDVADYFTFPKLTATVIINQRKMTTP